MNEEAYKKGGYWKHGVSKPKTELIKSRAIGPDGKVYQGETGQRLQNKRLKVQRHFERNA